MLFVQVCVRAVCSCRVIATLESVLSGVGGLTRLGFWPLRCMDQMVHYTPVWQSNCSLYTAYKHTCAHQHICTRSGALALSRARALTHTNVFPLSVCQNRAFQLGRTGFPRHTHLPDRQHLPPPTSPQMKDAHTFPFFVFFMCPLKHSSSFFLSAYSAHTHTKQNKNPQNHCSY